MAQITFRTKQEQPVQQTEPIKPARGEKQVISDGHGELSPLLYRQTMKEPYLYNYLGWDTVKSEMGHDMDGNMEAIEDYFAEQVMDKRWVNDKVGFKDYFKHLEKVTDTEHMPAYSKLGKMAEYVKYLIRSNKYGR